MRATFTYLIGPQKGERAKCDADRISVGRAPDNVLCLGDGARRVSSHHAEVIQRGDQYLLRDLGSTNGTMINGRRVVVSELAPDDLIEFGAGGPLLRFGIERPEKEDQVETVSSTRQDNDRLPSGAAVQNAAVDHRAVASLKSNATLIAALAAAMLLGGVGGIVASSRLRATDPESMSFAEIAELNRPAVVLIRTEFELLDSSGQVTTIEARTGSGFILPESGLIVTNRHVIRDWEYNAPPPGTTGRITKIEAILPHHTLEDAVTAEVYRLGPDTSVDVAILRIRPPSERFVHGVEPDISHTNPGDEVVVIGYPLGLDLLQWTKDSTADPSLSTGTVSRVGHDFIQLNLRAYHGNSGGPVLNRKGEVIGILTGNFGSAQEIALCTPIGAALELVSLGAQASLPASRNFKQAEMPALPGTKGTD
ncbi:MAG TPA: trypsin-like peptidase domain-containing protein [Blastocatellia bacterium]|nr:trypsin-like peptidase domain-containing protein [Blastocatellia bacterium]